MSEQDVIDQINRYATWLSTSTELDMSPPAGTLDSAAHESEAFDPLLTPSAPLEIDQVAQADRGRWRYALAAAVLVIAMVAAAQFWPKPNTSTVTSEPDRPDWVQFDQGNAFDIGGTSAVGESAPVALAYQLFTTKVLSTSQGYIAIGVEQRDMLTGVVWRSGDGYTWERVADPRHLWGDVDEPIDDSSQRRSVSLWAMAESDGTIVILGSDTSLDSTTTATPAAWSSSDGVTWTTAMLPADPSGRSVGAVVGTDEGFVALAGRERNTGLGSPPSMWHSTDGVSWQRADTTGLPNDAVVTSLATVDMGLRQRIVAVGSVGALEEAPAAWFSDDGGITWTAAGVPTPPPDHSLGAIADVGVGSDGLIGLGLRRTTTASSEWTDGVPTAMNGSMQLVLWQSDDGRTWQEQVVDSADGRLWQWPAIAVGPDGFVITAFSESLAGYQGASWISTEGSDLVRLRHPPGRSSGALAATGDGYVMIAPGFEQFSARPEASDELVDFGEPPEVWALVNDPD